MASSPTTATEKSESELLSDAVNHLVSGKRHLLVSDYMSAVASLQEACQLFSKHYGETADECAEPYLYYGKALLEFSRMETGVLGNALQGVPADEDEDDDEDKESEEGDEQVENPEKVTGEEREQIIQQVEAAIDENSRDLDIKMAELKKKNESSSVSGSSENAKVEPLNDSENAKEATENSKPTEQASERDTKTADVEMSEEDCNIAKVKESPKEAADDKKEIPEMVMASQTSSKMDEVAEKEVASKEVCEEVVKGATEKEMEKTLEEPVKDAVSKEAGTSTECNVQKESGTADETKEVVNNLVVEASKASEIESAMETDLEQEPKLKDAATETKIGLGDGDATSSTVAEKVEGKADSKGPLESCNDKMSVDEQPASFNSEAKAVGEEAADEGVSVKGKKSVAIQADQAMDLAKPASEGPGASSKVNGVTVETSDVKDNDVEMDEAEDLNEESESTGEKSQDEAGNTDGEQAGPSTSKAAKEDEDDVTNLQLAWEVLELAKVIMKRQADSDKTKELKVADVLLKLGEVSIESENYQQATDDLTECLTIQKKHLAPHDRAVAETLYQLGLAHSFNNRFEEAIESFTNSMKVIEERIAILKQSLEDKEHSTVSNNKDEIKNSIAKEVKDSVEKKVKASEAKVEVKNSVAKEEAKDSVAKEEAKDSEMEEEVKDGVSKEEVKDRVMKEEGKNDLEKEKAPASDYKEEEVKDSEEKKSESTKDSESSPDPWQDTKREIAELEELIPDIKAKIEDTEDMMKNTMESIKEAALQRLSEKSPEAPPKIEEKEKPVSNISHLIKRKRKPEEEEPALDTNDLKKPRPSGENGETGNHINGNGVLNGDSKAMETEASKMSAAPKETPMEQETSVA